MATLKSTFKKLYEVKGPSAVYEEALKHNLKSSYCPGCDADTPTIDDECALCGLTKE
jgi:predicted amidophosphoribosyltransferase